MINSYNNLLKQFSELSNQPEFGGKEYLDWVTQKTFIDFVQKPPSKSDVILYATAQHAFIYSVLAPKKIIEDLDEKDLDHWSCDPFSSWGISFNLGDKKNIWISPPLSSPGSKSLNNAEQILFMRDFDGRRENKSYIEISQRLTHSFGLHYVPERDAYCRFDEDGEIEDIIRVSKIVSPGEKADIRLVTIDRGILDEYLVLTDQVLIMLCDSTRFDIKNFNGWQDQRITYHKKKSSFYYHLGRSGKAASYLRGFQIIEPTLTKDEVHERHSFGDQKKRKYASFITQDWKNEKVRECSCDPKKMGNYFVKSKFPFETSPVFFRGEVLQRYKADTEKYRLSDRSIECKNAWYLKTYDINAAGQVHTYLVYLSHLPYKEQLYWKAFNEPPNGSISARAFMTDFEGKWDQGYDALHSLRGIATQLEKTKTPWWTLRNPELLKNLHYPITKSTDEWAKEIHTLDKAITEGFVVDALRAKATELGIKIDNNWRSIKLLFEIVAVVCGDKVVAEEIIAPFWELNLIRNKVSGHSAGTEAHKIKADILTKHNSYPRHFRFLCKQCDLSLRKIRELLEINSEIPPHKE